MNEQNTNEINPKEYCEHCQELVLSKYVSDEKIFCCQGCVSVYGILNSNGLSDYYELKKGHESLGRPEYSKDTYGYLDQDEFRAKYISIVSDKLNEYEFKFFVEGVHCVACLWLLEKINEIIPGVISSKLNMATSVLNIKLESETKLGDVARQIASLGYRPHPILQDSDKESYAKKEDHRDLVRIGIAFAAAGNIMLYSLAVYTGADGFFRDYFNYFSFICSLPIFFFCSVPFYRSAFMAIKNRDLSIDIPIVVALITGMGMGVYSFIFDRDFFYFDTLAILVFLLLFARYILKKAQQKSLSSDDLTSFFSNKISI